MKDLFTTEEKVFLCDMNVSGENPFDIFDYNQFHNSIIKDYEEKIPQIIEYTDCLWRYGNYLHLCCNNNDSDTSLADQYAHEVELLENAKFLMYNYDAQIKITSIDIIPKSITLNDHQYISALLDVIKKEITELKINRIALSFKEVIEDFKEGKNKEWVDKYIKNYFRKDSLSELRPIEEAELMEDYSTEFAHVISIFHRGFIDQKIETLKEQIELTKENWIGTPTLKFTHVGIQHLSFLLRIDEYINTPLYRTLDAVKLSNLYCKFIYSFLTFFRIYDNTRLVETSEPFRNIRILYKRFPKKNLPMIYEKVFKTKYSLEFSITLKKRLVANQL